MNPAARHQRLQLGVVTVRLTAQVGQCSSQRVAGHVGFAQRRDRGFGEVALRDPRGSDISIIPIEKGVEVY